MVQCFGLWPHSYGRWSFRCLPVSSILNFLIIFSLIGTVVVTLRLITSFQWPQLITPTSPNPLATSLFTWWRSLATLKRDSLPPNTPLSSTLLLFLKSVKKQKLSSVRNGRTAPSPNKIALMILNSLLMLWSQTCGKPELSGEKFLPTCTRILLKVESSS